MDEYENPSTTRLNESPRRKRTGYLNSFLQNILTPQSGGVFTLVVKINQIINKKEQT